MRIATALAANVKSPSASRSIVNVLNLELSAEASASARIAKTLLDLMSCSNVVEKSRITRELKRSFVRKLIVMIRRRQDKMRFRISLSRFIHYLYQFKHSII
jgi:hypothetical protein